MSHLFINRPLARQPLDAIRGVLADLGRAGVMEMIGSGRARLCHTVRGHPLVGGLESLFAAERARYDQMVAAVAEAASNERAAAWLFGSVARREDGPDSDLDVAIVVDTDAVNRMADDVREAVREHADRAGFRASVVSMSMEGVQRHRADGSHFWAGPTADAVVIKGGPPSRLAKRLPLNGHRRDR